ncbi:electron transfer flavoprotein subunit alpha/FixB family protein [Streptomyces sp. YIM S03343]
MADIWVFVTDEKWNAALGAAGRTGGSVTVAVVGPQALADRVATSGAQVVWVEPAPDTPAEAYAAGLAEQVAAAHPTLLVSTADPAARVLLGAAAATIGATVVPGVVEVLDGDPWTVRRAVLGGEAVETLVGSNPLAVILAGDDTDDDMAADADPGAVRKTAADASAMTVAGTEPAEAAGGIGDARIVVSFGRGVRQKADVTLVEQLAAALGAEVACSMPVADDLGWLAKNRYVGRSGQHISPRLYLAVGISGAPQHMEGVRGAKVVVAVNNDPEARIFRSADYGVVGDLYDVVPELIAELQR